MLFGIIGMILGLIYFYNGAEQKELIIGVVICAILGLVWTMLTSGKERK